MYSCVGLSTWNELLLQLIFSAAETKKEIRFKTKFENHLCPFSPTQWATFENGSRRGRIVLVVLGEKRITSLCSAPPPHTVCAVYIRLVRESKSSTLQLQQRCSSSFALCIDISSYCWKQIFAFCIRLQSPSFAFARPTYCFGIRPTPSADSYFGSADKFLCISEMLVWMYERILYSCRLGFPNNLPLCR